MNRIGIFSGVFDPIHKGHISFALTAAKQAKLDEIYFLVEPQPRRKTGVTHTAHRIAMTKLAVTPYPNLNILELPDKQFSIAKTLPRLKQRFKNSQLVFLSGADMLTHMPDWRLLNRMLEEMELVIGEKNTLQTSHINELAKKLPHQPKGLIIIKSPNPNVSSRVIRESLMAGKPADVLPNVSSYIKRNWLYVSPSSASSSSS